MTMTMGGGQSMRRYEEYESGRREGFFFCLFNFVFLL